MKLPPIFLITYFHPTPCKISGCLILQFNQTASMSTLASFPSLIALNSLFSFQLLAHDCRSKYELTKIYSQFQHPIFHMWVICLAKTCLIFFLRIYTVMISGQWQHIYIYIYIYPDYIARHNLNLFFATLTN
jgi:hypothetical protein